MGDSRESKSRGGTQRGVALARIMELSHVMSLRKLSPVLLVLTTSCLIQPDQPALVDFRVDALTQYNHRGMVQNDTGVLQGDMNVNLAVKGEGELDIRAWANMDLDSDTGDAWFPDGHGGEVTEAQYSATYTKSFDEASLSVGIFNYSVLNGSEFQQNTAMLADDRGPTTEVFARLGYDLTQAFFDQVPVTVTPAFIFHYDIDEVEDLYAEGNLRFGAVLSQVLGWFSAEDQAEWTENLSFGIEGNIGYSGDDHSLWAYGFAEEGFSDWRVSGDVSYAITDETTLRAMVSYGQIINSDLRDWFDIIDIDNENVWGGLGITWSF